MKPLLFALSLASLCTLAGAAPPNLVVLFSDDAGYADFGFQAKADPALAKLTPRLTALAKEGIVFSNAYVSGAVCSPSRAGLFTGRYQQRFGHEKNIPQSTSRSRSSCSSLSPARTARCSRSRRT